MRKINKVIIHCSATPEGRDYTVADIDRWHRERGFNEIGYHYVVYRDGSVHAGRDVAKIGAHCKGQNADSIGICYIGGLDAGGKAKDTRTEAQKRALRVLVAKLVKEYPIKEILGHRDTSPDTNGNGKVDSWERIKECPCFDAKEEYKDLLAWR